MKGLASLLVVGATISTVAMAGTYHVSTGGSDTEGDGSAEAPFATVAKGIVAATTEGDVVEVAAGTYDITQQLEVKKAVTIRGATGNPDDVIINNTKSDGVRRIFQLSSGARVESMTLQNGHINKDGGNNAGSIIHMHDAVVSNCVLQGGTGGSDSAHSVGVWMEGTSETLCRLENSVVRNNCNREGDINEPGGGVYIHTKGTVSGCMISNNYSRTAGGGVGAKSDATAIFKDCVIYDNYGGIMPNGSNGYGGGAGGGFRGTYINCLIAGNHSRNNGNGVHTTYGTVANGTLSCCTVIDNEHRNHAAAGLYNCTAYNTIIYNNTGNSEHANNNFIASGTGVSQLYYCCTVPESTNSASNKGGNIWVDPQFQSKTVPANLAAAYRGFEYPFDPMNFAVYEAGSYDYINGATVDLVGVTRVDPPDIGCVESVIASENIVVTSITTADRRSASFNVVLTSRGSSSATRATVTVVVSASEDMSDPVFTGTHTFTKDLDSQVIDTGNVLEPETTYFVRVSIANDASQTLVLPVELFTTLNERVIASFTHDNKTLLPAVSLQVEDFGSATKIVKATVRLWANADKLGEPVAQSEHLLDFGSTENPCSGLYVSGLQKLAVDSSYYLELVLEDDLGRIVEFGDMAEFTAPGDGDNIWGNTGNDPTDIMSYLYDFVPASNKSIYFATPAVEGMSPVVTADMEMPSLCFSQSDGSFNGDYLDGFHSCDYVVSGTGTLIFKNETAIKQNSFGTNVIENAIRFSRSNGQKARIAVSKGDLFLDGVLEKTEPNFTLRLESSTDAGIHLRGDSSHYDGEVMIATPDGATISLENPNALTGVGRFVFYGHSGKSRTKNFANNSGAPMVFAATNIQFGVEGWGSQCDRFNGFPFIFPEAQFNYCEREGNGTIIDADVTVKTIYHSGGNRFFKDGTAMFTLLEKHLSSAEIKNDSTQAQHDRTQVQNGCFYPMTADGWDAKGCIYLSGGTIGLNQNLDAGNFHPNLDGTYPFRPLSTIHNRSWGYTAVEGDVEVCYYDGTEICNVTNKNGPSYKSVGSTDLTI